MFCRDKQRGGTCILAKRNSLYRELSEIKSYATQKTFEVCGIEIPLHRLLVVCIYRTPTSDPNVFLSKLDMLMHNLSKKHTQNTKIVLTGDFNINTLKQGKITDNFRDLCLNYNLKIHINVPTRKESCIDHILSNIKDAVGSVLPLLLSDHDTAQLLSFTVAENKNTPKSYTICRRDYCCENILKLKECLSSISWSNVYSERNLNDAFQEFHELFCLFYSLCFPVMKKQISGIHKFKQNWISQGLKNSCKTKRLLRCKYYKNKTLINKIMYTKYSKLLKKCIVRSKKNCNAKFINISKNKSKAAWTVIKNEICSSKNCDNISELKLNNQTLTNPFDIASAFNDYFIELTNTNNETQNTQEKPYISKISSNSMFLRPMAKEEVKKEIMCLNNTKSEGFDGISTKIIKICVEELVSILTYLINLSFSSGTFPKILKESIVKPLYKKGEKSDVTNYRPITLIPIISKVFEKCMYKRLLNYCNTFKIINSAQFGFQKNKSTTLAIFTLVRTVLDSLNASNLTTGLFFDLSKAFDFVNHNLLLQKLESVGVRGPTLQWIASYLTDRYQRVVVNKIIQNELEPCASSYRKNTSGVPQGSVLGPLLFILYINDITDAINHKCILFADDISIVVTSEKQTDNSIRKHEIEIDKTINNVVKWLDANYLKLNLNKSNFIQFNKSKHIHCNFKLNIDKIKEITQTKFLGVIIDQDLSWKLHIESLCNRINSFVYALNKIRNVTDRQTVLTTYHAYVASLLRYGIIIWGNSTDKNRLFVAQKKCIRAICGIPPGNSCRQAFTNLGLLPLPALYIYEICCFVKQNNDLFMKAKDINTRLKRYPERLILSIIPKSAKYNNNCTSMCVRIYNKVPYEMRNLTINAFKAKLYKWLIDINIYDLKEFFDRRF